MSLSLLFSNKCFWYCFLHMFLLDFIPKDSIAVWHNIICPLSPSFSRQKDPTPPSFWQPTPTAAAMILLWCLVPTIASLAAGALSIRMADGSNIHHCLGSLSNLKNGLEKLTNHRHSTHLSSSMITRGSKPSRFPMAVVPPLEYRGKWKKWLCWRQLKQLHNNQKERDSGRMAKLEKIWHENDTFNQQQQQKTKMRGWEGRNRKNQGKRNVEIMRQHQIQDPRSTHPTTE